MKYQSNLYLRCTIRCSTVGSGRQFAAGDRRQLRLRPPTQKTGTHVRCIALISSATTAKSSARFAFMHWLVLHRWHSQKILFRAASDNCSTWAASRLGCHSAAAIAHAYASFFAIFAAFFLKEIVNDYVASMIFTTWPTTTLTTARWTARRRRCSRHEAPQQCEGRNTDITATCTFCTNSLYIIPQAKTPVLQFPKITQIATLINN